MRRTMYGKGDDGLEARIQAICADFDYAQAQTFGLPEDFTHDYTIAGGDFTVVLMTDYPEAAAIRVSRSDARLWNNTWYEYECTDILSRKTRSCPPPLRIPATISAWDLADVPYYAIEKLPGKSIGPDALCTFSKEELEQLGQKIGQFVAWMELNVSADDRWEAIARSNFPVHTSRMDYIQFLLTDDAVRQSMLDLGHIPLVRALQELEARACEYNNEGLFTPTMYGHGDLGIWNVLLEQSEDQWSPSAIIDNSIIPTTPENELRCVGAIGGVAIEAAISSYEDATGNRLDIELLNFWTTAQVLTMYAFIVMQPGYPTGGPPYSLQLLAGLEKLMPHIDWQSEKYVPPALEQSIEAVRAVRFTPRGHPAGDKVGFERVRMSGI